MKRLLVALLRLYQHTLSPDHGYGRLLVPGGACRFEPTCSSYAIAAIEQFGARRGGALAAHRLLRCHPLNHGGFDPVPHQP